jgi:integrase
MSRQSKGPHLHLRPARKDRKPIWVILDTGHEQSTGCGAGDRRGAEEALRDYLARKHITNATQDQRDPAAVPIADVVALYARDVAPKLARPDEVGQRLKTLLGFFGSDNLDTINGERCREYAAQASSPAAARRQLEDLRAAINHHRREGKCSQVVEVVLPPENPPRERWLSRKEAAKLLRHCWRHKDLKHVARFIVVSLYTGTRSSAVCAAALEPMVGRGSFDLDNGVFYRRPPRSKQTKKRQPSIRPPDRLLAHLRRWKANGQRFAVEWWGEPVKRISKAYARAVDDVGFDKEVVVHTLRHTAITWAMQRGADPWQVAGYFGVSYETLMSVYGHHHPDHQTTARAAFDRPANLRKEAV